MLQLKNLSCGYHNKTILKHINLQITQGEIIGIIGPNGSGKSTLVKTIASLLPPLKGEVFLKNKNISYVKPKDLAKQITLLSQTSKLPHFKVIDFVLTGRIPYRNEFQLSESKEDYKQALKAMKITGTYDLRNKLLPFLSGGEQQLCKIAKALTQNPQLLIMDEPNTGLDITHQIQIMDLIQKLNKKFQMTVIMVLHDLNLASYYCNRILMINKGNIHKFDKPDNVITTENIKTVYNTNISIKKHPKNNTPYIVIP